MFSQDKHLMKQYEILHEDFVQIDMAGSGCVAH